MYYIMTDNWGGYGPEWDKLRRKVYERDNYTCQRCGYNSRRSKKSIPIQAHHIIPKSNGGSDTMDNLITLCRCCHGVQHPDNEVFDDDRPNAPLFPYENAKDVVNEFPDGVNKVCQRCKNYYEISELTGVPKTKVDKDVEYGVPLCKKCAGVVCYNSNSNIDINDLESQTAITRENTIKNRYNAQPYPANYTLPELDIIRKPINYSEKLFVHKPLRNYGTIIVFVILTLLLHYYVLTPEYFQSNYDTAISISANMLLSSLITPPIRWFGSTLLYNIICFFDPTHKKFHYKPKISNIIHRTIKTYIFISGFIFMFIFVFIILLSI